MKDSEIIQLYWERKDEAISVTTCKYRNYCWKIAFNILQNNEDAEECVNDTWLHTWNAIPPQRPNVLSAFLGKITRNLSLDKMKERNAKKRGGGKMQIVLHELEECVSGGDAIKQAENHKEVQTAIDTYLGSLPEIQRKIFMRRYWYVDSISEISVKFNMSESKVTSMLYRIRCKLKSYLEKEGIWL